MVKNLSAMRETQIRSLGQEDPLEEGWQPTPVLLPGESHGQRLQSMGSQRVRHDWATNTVPVKLPGSDLLSELKGLIHLASSGHLTLEFPDQAEPDPWCSLQSVLDIEEKGFQQKTSNLNKVPENLWATSKTDPGRIKGAEPIKFG